MVARLIRNDKTGTIAAFAALAQLVEQLFCKEKVPSSSLGGGSEPSEDADSQIGRGSGNGSSPWRKVWENRGFPRSLGGGSEPSEEGDSKKGVEYTHEPT